MELLLLIVFILLVLGAAPVWPYSQTWGYNLFSVFALVLLVYLLLVLMGSVVLFHPVVAPVTAPVVAPTVVP